MPLKPAILISTVALILGGCQSSYISQSLQSHAATVANVSSDTTGSNVHPLNNWLGDFNDERLLELVNQGFADSFSLAQAAARVQAAQQQSIINGAPRLPTLDLNSSGQRQKLGTGNYPENYTAQLQLGWELDLWGRLNDVAKAGQLQWQAEQANYQYARLSLAGNIARGWYGLLAEQELENLLQQRVTNLSDNKNIIESGYRQGINSALDLYLARSDLASEKSRLHNQQYVREQAQRSLEILLGQKPLAQLSATQPLTQGPALQKIAADIPADTVYRRFDIQAAHLRLQAADREVAAAHKARYPGLRITGSGGDSSEEFKKLFDQSSLGWSLLGNLTQPLFSGGALKAREQQRLAQLREQEQQFLQQLHNAYAELFNALSGEQALRDQIQQLLAARDNAEAAYALAFERYQQGLQDYTTVLESQRRAFNSQSNVINARRNLMINRVNFYLATGATL